MCRYLKWRQLSDHGNRDKFEMIVWNRCWRENVSSWLSDGESKWRLLLQVIERIDRVMAHCRGIMFLLNREKDNVSLDWWKLGIWRLSDSSESLWMQNQGEWRKKVIKSSPWLTIRDSPKRSISSEKGIMLPAFTPLTDDACLQESRVLAEATSNVRKHVSSTNDRIVMLYEFLM